MNYCLKRSLSSSQAKVPVGCWWRTVCHHTAASPSSHSRAKVAYYCGLAIPANEKYSSQLYKKASSVAGSSLLPKKGRGFSRRTPLGRPPWPPLPPAPAPLYLELRHQGGRRGLGGANLLIAEPPVWSWLQRRSLRCAPLDSLPIAAGHSSVPAFLPSNSSTALSRPLISPLWRINDPQFGQSLERCSFQAKQSKTGSWLYKRANAVTEPKKNVKLEKKANKTILRFFLIFCEIFQGRGC